MSSPGLVLASASPRRLDLLAQCGIAPTCVLPADVDETPIAREKPLDYARRISRAKAEKIANTRPDDFVLAADTVVVCGQRILGKAENQKQAREFLTLLSGRRHRVTTSVSLIAPKASKKKAKHFIVTSIVKFKRLSKAEIDTYLATNDWVGKAGAYGIQGPAGAFITFISGSYTTIVGLPLYETVKALADAGYEH